MDRAAPSVKKRVGLLLGAGLLGGMLALFGMLMLIVERATARLTSFASDFLEQDSRIAGDITATLDRGNQSTYAFCSDEDIRLLRDLLFESAYLKDVGRVEGDRFFCSAVMGRMAAPTTLRSARVMSYKGRQIYFEAELEMARAYRAELVSAGKTSVVVSPTVFSEFAKRPGMTFAGAIVNPDTKSILQMYTSSTMAMPLDFMLSDKLMRRDGVLYYPRCSKTEPDCVLTAMPMKAIWAPHYSAMMGAFAVGMLAGMACCGAGLLISQRRRSLANQLRRSLKNKDLLVVYQPVVDVASGRMAGCEALVRWRDENGMIVRPDLFVAIAEEQGFVGQITRFVLEQVVAEIGDLLLEHKGFRVSVNLSAMDLTDAGFMQALESRLKAGGVRPESVGLELTERSTADREHVVKVIRDLRGRGHVVYIDDFGTGYSSLAYLSELSVDVLKIDRAFTKTIGTDSVTAAIVPQILEMARALKLKVVVEGVEEQGQAEYLELWGDGIQAQGWLYGRPVPAGELRTRLEAEAAEAGSEQMLDASVAR